MNHTAFTHLGRIVAERTTSPTARQQAIQEHLEAALYYVRDGGTTASCHRAVGHAVRAASLLKQVCKGIEDAQTEQANETAVARAIELGFKVHTIKAGDWLIGKPKKQCVQWHHVKTAVRLNKFLDNGGVA